MVDLCAKPYCLSDADIAWVESTIAAMTDKEKAGQLFWQLTNSQEESYLRELMEKYHLGGCRYNGMPGAKVLEQNTILQKYAKVPVFIACNPEQGANGVCPDGAFVSSGIKVGATRKPDHAQAMGRISGAAIAATGCNMAFAPVVDITYNTDCEEVLQRAFGGDADLVATMGKAYMDGLAAAHVFADVAVVSSANRDAGEEEWTQHGLLAYVDILLAQDCSSKAHCISQMLKFGYDRDKVLMVGDAPGDKDAADVNGVRNFPILVNREGESWAQLRGEALGKLSGGSFGDEYQQTLNARFLENLGG